MDSLLYQIYSGEYDFTPERGNEQQKLEEKLFAEWNKVQKLLGDEFMDRLLELEGERDDWRGFQYYRAGFTLGSRLMLEALTAAIV